MHNATSEAVVGPRDFPRVFNNIFLSLNFIGRVKKKRNDVTEIVLELEIADAIFRRERSDDRKCVCCSQAIDPETGTELYDRRVNFRLCIDHRIAMAKKWRVKE